LAISAQLRIDNFKISNDKENQLETEYGHHLTEGDPIPILPQAKDLQPLQLGPIDQGREDPVKAARLQPDLQALAP